MSEENDNMINSLYRKLSIGTLRRGKELFENVVAAIRETTGSRICSLWSINESNTNGKSQKSVSLIVRKLEDGITKHPSEEDEDEREGYSHELKDSFIDYVLTKTEPENLSYYACPINEYKKIKSKKALAKLEIKYAINIPVQNWKPEDKEKKIAMLSLYFIEKPEIEESQLESLSRTIRDAVSSCFNYNMLFKKQRIIQGLVENYNDKGMKKNLHDIFHPILHRIFRDFCKYEGASVFIWNHYNNYFELLSTTGIINNDKEIYKKIEYNNVFYRVGEGLTGKAAQEQRSIIICDLKEDRESSEPKYYEVTRSPGKTLMVIPIFRPSNRNEVIGIIRFVNKQNSVDENVVDYFNDTDVEIMEYASDYLALIIDYFLGEEERRDFIAKLSHEFKSPASSIFNHAVSLISLYEDDNVRFHRRFNIYMSDILILSKIQLQQTDTNLFISKVRTNPPCSERYEKVGCYLFKEIIEQGKYSVIPIARFEKIPFNKINIDIPDWKLYVDEGAFIMVFSNLLINAIKYRKSQRNEDFYVDITGIESDDDWLIINITDSGLGVDDEDKEKIFLLGYRGKNAVKQVSDGFGVGLHVVSQIIKDFGGEISITNLCEPTTFQIKLPKKLFNDSYTKETTWTSAK